MNLFDIPEEDLRERLREELIDLYDRSEKLPEIPAAILESDAYLKLNHLINENMELKMGDSLWQELEELVQKCSPNFRKNLLLLTGGNLSSYDFQTSLLIKCGLTPTQISKLLLRSKGAITSRRETLCLKIFDKQYGAKMIDGIIRLL